MGGVPANTLARTRARVFDALNRLAQDIGAAAGEITSYGYDAQGNLTSIVGPLNRTTAQSFDALNRLVRMTDPAGGQTQYGYSEYCRLQARKETSLSFLESRLIDSASITARVCASSQLTMTRDDGEDRPNRQTLAIPGRGEADTVDSLVRGHPRATTTRAGEAARNVLYAQLTWRVRNAPVVGPR
jgi:YD repeat-containing protein